jgi:surfactin synthase thioesterase subunit
MTELVRLTQHADPACSLVCFPWAGAGVAPFASWRPLLPETVNLSAIRLPGRESRSHEAPFTSLSAAAAAVVASLPEERYRRWIFFGHSLGALLAFETAMRLERESRRPPDVVVVSGAAAPSTLRTGRLLHPLDDAALWEELCRMTGDELRSTLDPEVRRRMLTVLRADLTMAETYAPPDSRVATPLIAYAGKDDPAVDAEAVGRWQCCSRRELVVRWFAGGHLFLREHPAAVVAALLGDIATLD